MKHLQNKKPIRTNPDIETHGKLIVCILIALVFIFGFIIFAFTEYYDAKRFHADTRGRIEAVERILKIDR